MAIFDLGAAEPDFRARAEKMYKDERARYQANTNDHHAAWQFGRACFDFAEFAANDKERESLAQEGIAVCRQVVAKAPDLAAARYYLALNLGQLARTRLMSGLAIVSEMEKTLLATRAVDEKYDFGGPDRSVGLLYLDAPGWPLSVGSNAKARKHLERAAELFPDFPENRLCLLEAYLRWDKKDEILTEHKKVEELLPKAREQFSGERWESAWVDWDKRWRAIQKKVKKFLADGN
ncbi:MAG: hypothetical protein AB1705_11170 [Verrucomicrobiota bacterium]